MADRPLFAEPEGTEQYIPSDRSVATLLETLRHMGATDG